MKKMEEMLKEFCFKGLLNEMIHDLEKIAYNHTFLDENMEAVKKIKGKYEKLYQKLKEKEGE